MPSNTECESVIESLSFMLAFHHFIEHSELNILYDNISLAKICNKFLKLEHPSIEDMNKIMAISASSVLSGSRFSGSSDFTIQKLIRNMVPYPRIHFAYPSYAPFLTKTDQNMDDCSLNDIVKSALDEENSLGYCDPKIAQNPDKRNVSLATCFQFRGEVQPSEVVTCLDNVSSDLTFPSFIPKGMISNIVNEPCVNFEDLIAPK